MSLLMKALKQAEQSKRATDKPDFAPAPEETASALEAQPEPDLEMASPDDATSPEPTKFKPHFSDLQAETASFPTVDPGPNQLNRNSSEAATPTAPGYGPNAPIARKQPVFAPPAEISRSTTASPRNDTHGQAKNLFAAKLPVRSNHKILFWALAAVTAVMVVAIQGYRLWKEYTRPTNFSTAISASTAVPRAGAAEKSQAEAALSPPPPTENTPLAEMNPPEASAANAPVEPLAQESLPRAGNAPSFLNPEEKPVRQRAIISAKTGASRRTAEIRNKESLDPMFFTLSGRDPIRITASKSSQRSESQIDIAYQSFMRNDFIAAKKEYQKVLESDSTNRDALLGLAAIAVKNQLLEDAAAYYQRLLSLNPRDATAQAGIIGLTGGVNPVESESRIKTFLSRQPDSDYLYFALGNIYLSQSRWPEAQDAFFHAYQLSPENPDYTFNLAVSLDHLNQPRQAADYYRKSLDLSINHPANFDRDSLQKRLYSLTASETQ